MPFVKSVSIYYSIQSAIWSEESANSSFTYWSVGWAVYLIIHVRLYPRLATHTITWKCNFKYASLYSPWQPVFIITDSLWVVTVRCVSLFFNLMVSAADAKTLYVIDNPPSRPQTGKYSNKENKINNARVKWKSSAQGENGELSETIYAVYAVQSREEYSIFYVKIDCCGQHWRNSSIIIW